MLVDLALVFDGTGTVRLEVNAASVICVSNRPRSMIGAAVQSWKRPDARTSTHGLVTAKGLVSSPDSTM